MTNNEILASITNMATKIQEFGDKVKTSTTGLDFLNANLTNKEVDVTIKVLRTDETIPAPRVAYNGTSAAFDVAASETTVIPANGRATVPVSDKFSIDQYDPYYMQIHLRSSLGFKHGLRCHIGIVDAGYTGDFGVSVVNNTDKDYTINKGDYFAQVLVLHKPRFQLETLSQSEWDAYEAKQSRGEGGFGSSGK